MAGKLVALNLEVGAWLHGCTRVEVEIACVQRRARCEAHMGLPSIYWCRCTSALPLPPCHQGPIAVARATLPRMLQAGRGRHVVVASMAAVVPSPGQVQAAGGGARRKGGERSGEKVG